MFKRLNTGGELLSDQEVRNCTIRLLGEKFNSFLIKCSEDANFKIAVSKLSKDKRLRMQDVELVLRFFAFKNNFQEFTHDIAPFLTDYMERVTDTNKDDHIEFDYENEKNDFEKVFRILGATLGENTCLRWLGSKYGGQFSNHQFEAITLGLGKVIGDIPTEDEPWDEIGAKLDGIKKDEAFQDMTTGGGQNSPGKYRTKIEFVSKGLTE